MGRILQISNNANLLVQAAQVSMDMVSPNNKIENIIKQEEIGKRIGDINEYLSGEPPLVQRAKAISELARLSEVIQVARSVLFEEVDSAQEEVAEDKKEKTINNENSVNL